jgi:hypothetical protein
LTSIDEKYFIATRSSNLKSTERTTSSHSDVLGAAGLAAKDRPLAIALERLLAGDSKAAEEIVELLAVEVWERAPERPKLRRAHAVLIAQAVLAWCRHGTCLACGGHGYAVIGTLGTGRAVISDHECPSCHGTKKRLFERSFRRQDLPHAYWIRDTIEAEMSTAGPAIMRKLAERIAL